MIGANMVARLGGMVILVLIGHSYSQDTLAVYFQLLAMFGLAVTATQAGSGPLLVRLAQCHDFRAARLIMALRALIAVLASALIIATTDMPLAQYWPLILVPLAAALAPDWMIAAKTRFSRLAMVAVTGQLFGLSVAVWAWLTHAPLALYLIAPAISLASLVLVTLFAFTPSSSHCVDTGSVLKGRATGLVGFTLLVGVLPNLDFVLLGTATSPIFLAQRVFLFCAGLSAAVASTLFAKQQTGLLRDIWLLLPMTLIAGLLFVFPEKAANLVYSAPSDDLVHVLRIGAAWPLLFALLTRQILILQELSAVKWVGWVCLFLMACSAFVTPPFTAPTDTMVLIVTRMVGLVMILFACQKALTKQQVMT
jgi:hypothetical protein